MMRGNMNAVKYFLNGASLSDKSRYVNKSNSWFEISAHG
jgi:hypothetical protein